MFKSKDLLSYDRNQEAEYQAFAVRCNCPSHLVDLGDPYDGVHHNARGYEAPIGLPTAFVVHECEEDPFSYSRECH